jgi:hypothetical protein
VLKEILKYFFGDLGIGVANDWPKYIGKVDEDSVSVGFLVFD